MRPKKPSRRLLAVAAAGAVTFTAGALGAPNAPLASSFTDTVDSSAGSTVTAGNPDGDTTRSPALAASRGPGGICNLSWTGGNAAWLQVANTFTKAFVVNSPASAATSFADPFTTPRATTYTLQGSNATSLGDAADLSDNWLGYLQKATCGVWSVADDFANGDTKTSTGDAQWITSDLRLTGGSAGGSGLALLQFKDPNVNTSVNVGGNGEALVVRSDASGQNYTRLRTSVTSEPYTASWTETTATTTRTKQADFIPKPIAWVKCGARTTPDKTSNGSPNPFTYDRDFPANFASGDFDGKYYSGGIHPKSSWSGPAGGVRCGDTYQQYADGYQMTDKITIQNYSGFFAGCNGSELAVDCYHYSTTEFDVATSLQSYQPPAVPQPDVVSGPSYSSVNKSATRYRTRYAVALETVRDGVVVSSTPVWSALRHASSSNAPTDSESSCRGGSSSSTSGSITTTTSCSTSNYATGLAMDGPASSLGFSASGNSLQALVNGAAVTTVTNGDTGNTYHGIEGTSSSATLTNYRLDVK